MKRNPPVSIVVPAYNAQDTIAECIEALLDQDYTEKEIIIVDDGSEDDTSQFASEYQDVTVINTERGGAARATNIGIEHSKYDIIVSVDSDAVLEKNWLKKIVPEFQDSSVGAVGGYPLTVNKGILGKLMGLEVESRFDKTEKYVDHLYTMNTAYRKKAVKEVGLFNESMKVGYDNDISYKLKVLGYKIVLVKEAKCYHHWREDLKGYSKQQYNSAYFRLELIKNFKKPFDDISGINMVAQVPITLLSIVLAPFYLPLLMIPFLIQIPITLRLFFAKKDKVLLVMPLLLYFRNLVWILAAAKWGLDSLNPFK